MANLNQIELPNGGTYNFEDTEGRKEENLQWGGNSHAGEVSPIGMSLSNEHSANRIAYINGASLYFEYSSDSGSSWTNYGYSDAIKSQFCTTSYGVPIGRASTSTNYSTSSRTRITLTAQNGTTGYVYTNPRKMLINISSSGGMQVLVETRTGTNYQGGGAWSTFGTYTLSGLSGWNDIPLILSTLGGGASQTGNNWQLRLTFIMTSFNSSYPTTAQVSAIRIYGENSWQTTSNMGATGHLYSYDASQNAVFPANVQINNGKQVGYLTATPTSGQVVVADGTSGGIKTSGYTIAKSVPSDAQFTDNNTTYTFANGTNGFTVTPSGGSAQTVTVTPSITNNVTGSGTSGYIAKFDGTNTITNGPAIGSGTTKFLREDGTWQTPSSGSGTVTSVTIKGSSPISVDSESAITTSGTRTISHANSGATAGSYGDSSAQTPNYGGTFKVPYVTVNATGHVTGISEHTVKIPASDNTNTTYTFANGTNGFTVTPSGGSAQTVTVTPSISNNVTGSGTSGYLTKFNGANTITNGPQLGSSTTTFLSNAGTWLTPNGRGNKIYTVEPTPPYSVGDLWLIEDNNISVCNNARASGSFDSDDWGSAVDAISNEELQDAILSTISNTLTIVTGNGEDGGNIIWRLDSNNIPYELLVTDTPTDITANTAKIYRWDSNGLRYSSTGYNGTYTTLINSSGQIPAQYLTGSLNAGVVSIQNFTAAMIHGGVFARGDTNNQDGTIQVKDNSGTVIAEISNIGCKYYGQGTGDDRPYYLINTSGFIGYTKVNGTWTQTVKVAFDEFQMVKGYVSEELNIGGKIKLVPMTTSTNDGIAFVAVT